MSKNLILKSIKENGYNDVYHRCEWSGGSLGEINVIYGKNGSGKSTIARIITNTKTRDKHFDFYNDKENYDFKVFSRDFIDEQLDYSALDSLDSADKHSIKKILRLGGNAKLKKQHDECVKELRSKTKIREDKENALKVKQSQYATFIRGNIGNHFARIIATSIPKYIQEAQDHINELPSNVNLRKYIQEQEKIISTNRLDTIEYSDLGEIVNNLSEINQDYLIKRIDKVTEICNTDYAEQAVQDLVEKQEFLAWIKEGLTLHEEHDSKDTCAFCKNSINKTRWEEIKLYFEKPNEKLENEIKAEESLYQIIEIEEMRRILSVHTNKFYDFIRGDYQQAIDDLIKDYGKYTSLSQQLLTALNNKKNKILSREVNFDNTDTHIDLKGKINKINELIERNKKYTQEIDKNKQVAQSNLLYATIHQNGWIQEHDSLSKQKTDAKNEEQVASKELTRLNNELNRHDKSLYEINEKLNHIFGDKGIAFELSNSSDDSKGSDNSEGGYTIKRRGRPAEHLSEGEKNIIALVYFIHLLKDEKLDENRLCVVLDDPISSFDNEFFYYAMNMIRDLITSSKAQILILTHSYPVFDHISGTLEPQNTNYYILHSYTNEKQEEILKTSDMNREEFEEESYYNMSFRDVYALSGYRKSTTTQENLNKANNIRCLIEGFSKFEMPTLRGNYKRINELLSNIRDPLISENIEYISNIITDLLNHYSHGQHPIDPSSKRYYDKINLGTVARFIMQGIKSTNKRHYCQLVKYLNLSDIDNSLSDQEKRDFLNLSMTRNLNNSNSIKTAKTKNHVAIQEFKKPENNMKKNGKGSAEVNNENKEKDKSNRKDNNPESRKKSLNKRPNPTLDLFPRGNPIH